jgi:TPP-dependent indolepyruvate ferredoxin oxidoreductase alpha subunit
MLAVNQNREDRSMPSPWTLDADVFRDPEPSAEKRDAEADKEALVQREKEALREKHKLLAQFRKSSEEFERRVNMERFKTSNRNAPGSLGVGILCGGLSGSTLSHCESRVRERDREYQRRR